MKRSIIPSVILPLVIAANQAVCIENSGSTSMSESSTNEFQYQETRDLVQFVNEAADLLHNKGRAAFADFRVPGSRWQTGEQYIFVLNEQGTMLVHPDAALEGKNQLGLKDINGSPIIRGLISAVTTQTNKTEGWYQYQWPVPGGLLPRWKSTYVRLVTTPDGGRYIVGSGIYNDRMEKTFVVDMVKDAVGEIEKNGTAAFRRFHDPTGPFIAKDAYIFVIATNGVELVNPAFPSLEGRNIMNVKDTQGKELVRGMLKTIETSGSGWVNYMWPKPGESVSTLKSAYVTKAKLGDSWVMVGSGVYLADAPKAAVTKKKMTAPELMTLVRQAAVVFEKEGEKAYSEFRQQGSKWFRNDTYFFVWTMDGTRVFHAANPSGEGINVSGLKDVLGRPVGKMILEAAASPSGEGWVHYMYPEPGDIFPTWKSTFVKRVMFPSSQPHIIGCGIYNMQMDAVFIKDVVDRAVALVEQHGPDAFPQLRDKTGPYFFFDTYVFVIVPDGTELVNPAQPSLEGKNIMNLKDVNGKLVIRECVDDAMNNGSGWVNYFWYKPGENIPARKHTYVRKAQYGGQTYIVGSGYYPEDEAIKTGGIKKTSWNHDQKEQVAVMDVGFSPRDEGKEMSKAQKTALNTVAEDKTIETKEVHMNITRAGSQPSRKGSSDWFTGTVRIDPLFEAEAPSRTQAISVTFEPGARTLWHTHPLGQHLIVTAGIGWVQRWNDPIEEIRPGDVVSIPSGEKHWHGATATTAMTHIAVYEQLDGNSADWMEPVSNEQYRK